MSANNLISIIGGPYSAEPAIKRLGGLIDLY